MKYDLVIVGGGFNGIYAAWRAAKDGGNVALMEASGKLGGIMHSFKWKNFMVDHGTQELDVRSNAERKFFADILDDQYAEFQSSEFASITDKNWTAGFEMPDYSHDNPEMCRKALCELKKVKSEIPNINGHSYVSQLLNSYGTTLTEEMLPSISKYIDNDPNILASESSQYLSIFNRPKLGTDIEMLALKSSDRFWDDRLGVTRNVKDRAFSGSHISNAICYPKSGGLSTFCIKAKERLSEMGVDIFLDTTVQSLDSKDGSFVINTSQKRLFGKHLLWSLPEALLFKLMSKNLDFWSLFVPVGMNFYAFEIDQKYVKSQNYLNDFYPYRKTFRYSNMGSYSNQVTQKGSTFIVSEVPCHPNKINSNEPSETLMRIFAEFLDVEFILSEAVPIDSIKWSHPLYYALPKVGWRNKYNNAMNKIKEELPGLMRIPMGLRGRGAFVTYYEKKLKNIIN
ncbi:NAD(P)-binding protein [Paracoccaceae bacterium]|nr:NAD(P)-binding protein [Paracoccaceae bacterium]